jgi:hypothetical protein
MDAKDGNTPKVVQPVAVASVPQPVEKTHKPGTCGVCGKPLFKGEIGDTCLRHIGKLRINADVADKVPEGYIRHSKVCRALETKGLSTHTIVKASGGDACTGEVLAPVFRVTYVGGAKFLNPDVLTEGANLLLGATLVKKANETVATSKTDATVNATANALKNAVVKK